MFNDFLKYEIIVAIKANMKRIQTETQSWKSEFQDSVYLCDNWKKQSKV